MKKILMYVIIFALCVAICEQRIDYTNGNVNAVHSPIALSFASIGAISFESRLDSWAKINSAATPQELDQIAETVLASLDLTDIPVKSEASEGTARRECKIEQKNSFLKVVIQADYQTDSTNIIFTYYTREAETDTGDWVHKLENIAGWDWHHYYLFSAYLPEPTDSETQEQLLQAVMKDLEAKTKEVYVDDRVMSLSGYSQILSDMVIPEWVGNHHINVQTVIRNQTDGKSVIMIGSPFILGDY
jgi:hypothetical protein